MPVTETLPRWRIGAAALAVAALPLTGAGAATRTGTLELSITILGQCSVRTAPWLQPGDIERLFLSGDTGGVVRVRCTQGTPYSLAWSRDPLPAVRPAFRFASFGTAPFNPRFEDLLDADSPLSLTDSPSRLLIPPALPEAGPDAPVGKAPGAPPMIVITF